MKVRLKKLSTPLKKISLAVQSARRRRSGISFDAGAIFGMHTIKERAIVENGAVIAEPMMFIAISYDRRIIDGKDAVQFLVAVKNYLEDPVRLMLHI